MKIPIKLSYNGGYTLMFGFKRMPGLPTDNEETREFAKAWIRLETDRFNRLREYEQFKGKK